MVSFHDKFKCREQKSFQFSYELIFEIDDNLCIRLYSKKLLRQISYSFYGYFHIKQSLNIKVRSDRSKLIQAHFKVRPTQFKSKNAI